MRPSMEDAPTNGFNATTVKRFLGEAMRVYDKLDAARIEYMNECREIREPLKDIEDMAKNAGLPKAAFRALVKSKLADRAHARALEKARPKDEDEAEAWEALREIAKEGDLFAHAVKEHDDEDRDLRPRSLQEREAERIAKENAARIAAGISELDDGLGD